MRTRAMLGTIALLSCMICPFNANAEDPPPADAHLRGHWTPVIESGIAVHPEHMLVLKNGKVMLIKEFFGMNEPVSICQS